MRRHLRSRCRLRLQRLLPDRWRSATTSPVSPGSASVRPIDLWRYAGLLPVPVRRCCAAEPQPRLDPPAQCRPTGRELGMRKLWVKDDSGPPSRIGCGRRTRRLPDESWGFRRWHAPRQAALPTPWQPPLPARRDGFRCRDPSNLRSRQDRHHRCPMVGCSWRWRQPYVDVNRLCSG